MAPSYIASRDSRRTEQRLGQRGAHQDRRTVFQRLRTAIDHLQRKDIRIIGLGPYSPLSDTLGRPGWSLQGPGGQRHPYKVRRISAFEFGCQRYRTISFGTGLAIKMSDAK